MDLRQALVIRQNMLTIQLLQDDDDDSSSEEDNEIITLMITIKNVPNRMSKYIENVVAKYSDTEFRENFRMTREAFHLTINKLLQVYEGEDVNKLEKNLLAVLWLLATPDSYRSVGGRFDMGKSSLSAAFVQIVNGLNCISNFFLKWPNEERKMSSKIHFAHFGEGFQLTFGVIDGTYVPIKAPKDMQRVYTNRKKFTGMTLQAVCDERLAFIDCFTGYPSSVNDLRVFRNSTLFNEVQQRPEDYFINGENILGDKAYQNLPWLKSPFINRGNLNEDQILYNNRHAVARSVVERSFALLFGRLRRLRDLDMNRLDWIPATIMASCVVHNICIICKDNIDDYIEEGLPVAVGNAADNF